MGLWARLVLLARVKGRAVLGHAENPIEVLDYAGEQQQELLRQLKQGLIEVAISKRQLQQQVEKLNARIPQIEDQASRALTSGREDLARIALGRKQKALIELEGLDAHVVEVEGEEQRLALAEQELSARIEEFRMHRQTMTARYTAAEAKVKVNEALTGVSKDFSELSMALMRTEEKIGRMLAHASAVDSLVESGAMSVPLVQGDVLERELQEVATREAVDTELKALQSKLGFNTALGGGDKQTS